MGKGYGNGSRVEQSIVTRVIFFNSTIHQRHVGNMESQPRKSHSSEWPRKRVRGANLPFRSSFDLLHGIASDSRARSEKRLSRRRSPCENQARSCLYSIIPHLPTNTRYNQNDRKSTRSAGARCFDSAERIGDGNTGPAGNDTASGKVSAKSCHSTQLIQRVPLQ